MIILCSVHSLEAHYEISVSALLLEAVHNETV